VSEGKKTWIISLFYSAYAVLVVSLLGNLIGSVLSEFFGAKVDRLFWQIVVGLLTCLANYLIFTFLTPNKEDVFLIFNQQSRVKQLALALVTICICSAQFIGYFFLSMLYPLILSCAYAFIIMGFWLKVQVYNEKRLRTELQRTKESEFENLKSYTKHIEEMYEEVRVFKHDYQNMLIFILKCIENQDYAEVEEYFQSIAENTSSKIPHLDNIADLSNIKLPNVKGFISYKILSARNSGIDVQLECREELLEINMPTHDFVRIISNLLDNAMEAAGKSIEKKMNIAIFENQGETGWCVVIANYFLRDETTSLAVEKLYEKGFSTKGKNRGLGLSIVLETINKYPQVSLESSLKSNLFFQCLNIEREI
jgi:two-component system sensor histidine kinase AgrC